MTIPVQNPINTYIGDGVQDTFAFIFRILETNDVIVSVNGVIQTLATDYDLLNVTEAGGDVVFVPASVPGAQTFIELKRSTDQSQDTNYNPFDPFPAKTHELALDKLTMIIQELQIIASPGVGLPLDPTGQFWDAGARQIKNLLAPLIANDAANKGYVDSQVGNPFDPSEDQVITGLWNFAQVITGSTTGNLVPSSLDPYPQKNIPEVITGLWAVVDGAGSPRKIGARNPRERALVINTVPTQVDEGIILRVTVPITSIILDPLESQTTFSIFAEASGFILGEGTGVTISWFDGQGNAPPTGDRVVARGSVIDIVFKSSNEVSVFGNGIS